MRSVTIVKLGGSHAFAEALPAWLSSIEAGAGKTVLVAGGGPFADVVRSAQPRMGFDDRAADAMALLAMEQYALAIAAMGRVLTVAESRSGILGALRAGKLPVWAPRLMVRQARRKIAPSRGGDPASFPGSIPVSWDITSDSLAAWLAGTLGARRLLIIKRLDVERDEAADIPMDAGRLAELGVVDPAFPEFLAQSGVASFLLGPREREGLAAALRDGASIGRPIGLVVAGAPFHHDDRIERGDSVGHGRSRDGKNRT